MNSVYWIGSGGTIGAIRIPAAPATRALSVQLAAVTWSAAMPLTWAPFSLCATARLASPKRVNRPSAQTPTAIATTEAANHTLSLDAVTSPPRCHSPFGKIRSTGCGRVPSRWVITPAITTATPSEATALATGGAERSGRNTTA
jgi:hypothetical protein